MSSTAIARQALGNRLMRLRKRAALSHLAVGRSLRLEPGLTVLWESGAAPIERADVERLLTHYEAGPVDRDRVLQLLDRPAVGGVVISYRRADSGHAAGRLYDHLARSSIGAERTYRDIESIRHGVDFVDDIDFVLDVCAVMLVVIGPDWLEAQQDGRRRLDDPDDLVRREVARALERNVFTIPVLLDGTAIPTADRLPAALAELPFRNACTLTNANFGAECDALITRIEGLIARQ